MFVETIRVGIFQCNCTIVACEATGKAIVVDPGDEPERIVAAIRKSGLDVIALIHTHAHLDHIMGGFAVAAATGAAARLHEEDRSLWDNVGQIAAGYHIPTPKLPPLAESFKHDDTLGFGHAAARVIHTPGHTAGSCCFSIALESGRQLLLSGDTLFRGRIGFSGPPYRTRATLIGSIRNRLLVMDDDTQVIPGHGPPTTIGIERRHNSYIA